jgi:Family of unknown function (DUF6498)
MPARMRSRRPPQRRGRAAAFGGTIDEPGAGCGVPRCVAWRRWPAVAPNVSLERAAAWSFRSRCAPTGMVMHGPFTTSALSLLGVNLGVIVFALVDDWSLPTILASYLVQSIIIGLFQAKKMSDLTVFSTDGFLINDHPVKPTVATRREVVVFFLVHYGAFHAAYAAFILSAGRPNWLDVAISGTAFFANHLYSYVVNRIHPAKRVPNIGTMMFFPYIRIVPMHVFIVFGALTAGPRFALVIFLLLKTLADEAMHLIEHRRDEAQP